jgi:hypothetical protein
MFLQAVLLLFLYLLLAITVLTLFYIRHANTNIANTFTGKMRLLRAIEWWTLQLNYAEHVVKTAYTWQASKKLDTPLSGGHSTCHAFGIGGFEQTATQSRRKGRQQLVGHSTLWGAVHGSCWLSMKALSSLAPTSERYMQQQHSVGRQQTQQTRSAAIT